MPRDRRAWAGTVVVAFVAILSTLPVVGIAPPTQAQPPRGIAPVSIPPGVAQDSDYARSGAVASAPLALSASASPGTVCAYAATTCPSVGTASRVTILAAAHSVNESAAPAVQVLFLVETKMFDGTCDGVTISNALGVCPHPGLPSFQNLSLFLPLFLSNSGTITASISALHAGLNVSYALADFETPYPYDDGDGYIYKVDIGSFVSAAAFPTGLNQSRFAATLADQDVADNLLLAPSISALYAALNGVALNWSNEAHHVIVVIGTAAPRDPNYPMDLSQLVVGSSLWSIPTCEPASGPTFSAMEVPSTFTSPACEGWVLSQTGNASESIAALTSASPACAGSVDGACTIDVVDLAAAPTNPSSRSWTNWNASNAHHSDVVNDTRSVLLAGCDLANATGGSWAGPTSFACPNGMTGTITDDVSTVAALLQQNTTLLAALARVGMGPPSSHVVAQGTSAPMFSFVLGPGIAPAPNLNATASCATPAGPSPHCPSAPNASEINGSWWLTWNWSSRPSENNLFPGETWSASFDLAVSAPPGLTPLDACPDPGCASVGGGGFASGATFVPWTNRSLSQESFPAVTVVALAPPDLSATLSPGRPVVDLGTPVRFEWSTTGGVPPYVAQIDFGDGTHQALNGGPSTMTHSYGESGFFSAFLTVNDSLGTPFDAFSFVTVLTGLAVVLTVPDSTTIAPTSTFFAAQVSGGLRPYRYAWSFGDGGSGTGPDVVHVFGATGNYSGSLEVDDATNASVVVGFDLAVLDLTPALHLPLAARATTSLLGAPEGACSSAIARPGLVAFAAEATGGTGPYSFWWDFGDGTSGAATSNGSHRYATPGRYTAVLLVTDALGASNSASSDVEIPSVPCGTTHSSPGWTSVGWIGPGLALGAIVVAAAVLWRWRHRRTRR